MDADERRYSQNMLIMMPSSVGLSHA